MEHFNPIQLKWLEEIDVQRVEERVVHGERDYEIVRSSKKTAAPKQKVVFFNKKNSKCGGESWRRKIRSKSIVGGFRGASTYCT